MLAGLPRRPSCKTDRAGVCAGRIEDEGSPQHVTEISTDTLIPLREAPRHLPPRPNGKRVHISACYRWISHGVRGVHLESIKIGGFTYTSVEALQRFADTLRSPAKKRRAVLPNPVE